METMVVVLGLAAAGLVGIAVAFYFTVRRNAKLGLRPPGAVRGRRRVSWRNGADVDEELWPVEAFGGISDEQFWDDMASDKPLTTTARTAQPAQPAQSSQPAGAKPQDAPRSPAPGNRAGNPGGNPRAARPAPAARPAAAATQLIPTARPAASGPQPAPAARHAPADTQPVAISRAAPADTQPVSTARHAATAATQIIPAVRPPAAATPPAPPAPPAPAGQPAASSRPQSMLGARPAAAGGQPKPTGPAAPAATQPAPAAGPAAGGETRGRGLGRHGNRKSAEEDPLTSTAFALRASGPVDGRSFLKATGSPGPAREQPAERTRRPGSGAPHAGTSPYPAPERPYREPSPATPRPGASGAHGVNSSPEASGAADASWPYGAIDPASATTPPYGESYGNGGEPSGPPYLNGNGRPYPTDTRHQGGTPSGGSYPGGGYRRPHDPWSNGSRLNITAQPVP
jgi:hypothetical protein